MSKKKPENEILKKAFLMHLQLSQLKNTQAHDIKIYQDAKHRIHKRYAEIQKLQEQSHTLILSYGDPPKNQE